MRGLAHHHRYKRYLMVNYIFEWHVCEVAAQVGSSHDPLVEVPDDLGHDRDTTVFVEQSLRHVLQSEVAHKENQLPCSG